MVAGQFPRRRWRNNSDGQIRNLEEAVQIAKKYGVVIPDDIEFHVDESGELNNDLTARGPRVDKPMGERV
jgi:LPS O-antigen subunit length determinant protein (WzzB/FepE family)